MGKVQDEEIEEEVEKREENFESPQVVEEKEIKGPSIEKVNEDSRSSTLDE